MIPAPMHTFAFAKRRQHPAPHRPALHPTPNLRARTPLSRPLPQLLQPLQARRGGQGWRVQPQDALQLLRRRAGGQRGLDPGQVRRRFSEVHERGLHAVLVVHCKMILWVILFVESDDYRLLEMKMEASVHSLPGNFPLRVLSPQPSPAPVLSFAPP